MENKTASLAGRFLPGWHSADLPEPRHISWRHWTSFLGPGIVMAGIQIGGGEWLFGPEITARYGGGLMWIATIAIILQVFYNIECGRYALYCGEPVFTGFMRLAPGPWFWVGLMLTLNASALIPGLSTHGAAIIASIYLDRPPGPEDRMLVSVLAYICLLGVVFPILVGGKIYSMLQFVMTIKVAVVLGFCLIVGIFFVDAHNWWLVFSGFAQVGNVPVSGTDGQEEVVNAFSYFWNEGTLPIVTLSNIGILGAFAGYAGGGGLSNSTYSNYVRDKGWGMGKNVGAIASAIGGKSITLSHVGTTFPISLENLRRWKGWFRYILTDQLFIWAPGCFLGMGLPALLSLQFARYSDLHVQGKEMGFAQAVISADGLRHAPMFSQTAANVFWLFALFAGLCVMLPSQMAIVDDFTRRWTDAIWSASGLVRRNFRGDQVKWIYYGILSGYVLWSLLCAYLFTTPKLMTLVIANLNNLAIGITSLQLVWLNLRLLPKPLRPRWYQVLGVLACAAFYLGMSWLVFLEKQWPVIREMLGGTS